MGHGQVQGIAGPQAEPPFLDDPLPCQQESSAQGSSSPSRSRRKFSSSSWIRVARLLLSSRRRIRSAVAEANSTRTQWLIQSGCWPLPASQASAAA